MLIFVDIANIQITKDSFQRVSHTHQVELSLNQLLSSLKDAETGQRGFLLTEQENYLEPYYLASDEVFASFDTLKRLTRDNPKQQQSLQRVKTLIASKLEELNKTIELIKKNKFQEALDIVKTNSGKNTMDSLRVVITDMAKVEVALLAQRKQIAEDSTTRSLMIRWICIVILSLIGVFLIARARRVIAQRSKEEKIMKLMNTSLEESNHNLRFLSNHQQQNLEELTIEVAKKIKELDFQKFALDEHAIVSIADIRGTIIYVNDKFCDISGYSREELIGNNHRILKSDEHSLGFFKTMWQTIAKGQVWHGDIKNFTKSGGYYWVKVTIVPFLDERNKPFQYVAIRTDITERKKAEFEAIIANEAKSEFLSSMSHELRTPLNSILGFAELLIIDKKSPMSDGQQASVNEILRGGKHLLCLVNDILALSAIETGSIKASIEDIQIKRVINDVLPLITSLANSSNVQVYVTSESALTIKADYTKLKQIMINLLSNAIKYNSEQGIVTVEWHKTSNNTVKISVIDTGIGIPKNKQKNVFDAFCRLGHENSTIEGAGIGLVVTKKLIEMMDGTIGFESIEGYGSDFWVELPISETQEYLDSQEHLELQANKLKNILYVEGNSINSKLMQAVCKLQPHNLHIVNTGELGLEFALKQDIDLILMDINLPGMSGKELTKKLRQTDKHKNTSIVAVTAAEMVGDIELSNNLFDDYVTKPIEVEKLLNLLKKYLD